MISVGDGIADDRFQEDTEHSAGFLINQIADTLDTTTAGKTTNGWLGDTLNVITESICDDAWLLPFLVLSTFSTSSHCFRVTNESCVC